MLYSTPCDKIMTATRHCQSPVNYAVGRRYDSKLWVLGCRAGFDRRPGVTASSFALSDMLQTSSIRQELSK